MRLSLGGGISSVSRSVVGESPQTYILVGSGESTMVGRAEDNDPLLDTTDPRILQLGRIAPDNNTLILGDDPLQHYDDAQTADSIGVMMEYARTLLPNIGDNDQIIIVPVARGGSGFYDGTWIDGGYLYEDAITRANLVKALDPGNSTVIWVSALGINDGFYDAHDTYQTNFDTYDFNIRRDLTGDNYEMLHLVMGAIPAAVALGVNVAATQAINEDVENRLDNCVYVQWDDGLPISGEDSHPNGVSNRTMGARLYTNQAAFVPTPQPVPDVPVNLTVIGQEDQVLVSWDLVNNADSYVLEYKLDSEPTTWTEVLTALTSITVTGLTNDLLYNFRVKSRNGVGDSAYSSIVDGTPFPLRESDAAGHWILGSDNPSYLDINGTNALTPVGLTPSLAVNYAETFPVPLTTNQNMNGLKTHIPEIITGQTMWMVAKLTKIYNDLPVVQGAIIMGNLNISGSGGGFGVFQQRFYANNNNGDYGDLILDDRGLTAPVVAKEDPTDEFFFIMISLTGTEKITYYKDKLLGTLLENSVNGVITSSNPVRDLGFGNVAFDNNNYKLGLQIAEGGIINSSKLTTEALEIYNRSMQRMLIRNIEI